ncbi:hypothetical protein GOARA_050_00190 [Gordonia araii NBRC 100433]|uniref:ESAT-6-like protein n=1 Tax=Gordonia araii NBRC 100433 TaxID=1073574 RepID=G7H282_9ACTN|nr:WXG100 family type VII secretion target [Gordonia araii]NNG97496.1 WXG100 family type VII secretion target [Gordonia araii NBRC 100433]GAB09957.1 hypothetical protein GOARA_050_00190 [Gordonia araii NBRC 100433]
MPGSGLNLDVAASMASTKSVAGIVDEMQQVIRAIQQASQNAATTWKGRASGAYDTTHADWSASATKLNVALEDIKAKLTSSFAGYGDEDDSGAATITGSLAV